MTPIDQENAQVTRWANRLSRHATTILILGLLAYTLTESSIKRATQKPTTRAQDLSVCGASVVATALAVPTAPVLGVVGGITAACQCVPVMVDEFEGMTCP